MMLFGMNLRRHSKLVFAAAAGLCLAVSAAPARASVYANAYIFDDGLSKSDTQTSGFAAAVNGTVGGVQGDAYASASYGVLHVYTHGLATSTFGNASVTAEARFDDMVTISGGTGRGYLFTDMIVEGTVSNGGVPTAVNVTWPNAPGGTVSIVAPYMQTKSGTFTFTGYGIGFTFGVPFDFSADIIAGSNWSTPSGGGSGEGLVNMINTATIGNIQVLDSNFNTVSNFTMIGSTGTDYTNLVPEPTSGTLLLAGIVVPMLRRKR